MRRQHLLAFILLTLFLTACFQPLPEVHVTREPLPSPTPAPVAAADTPAPSPTSPPPSPTAPIAATVALTPTGVASPTAKPLPTATATPTATPTLAAATPLPTLCPPDSECAPTPVPPSLTLENTENILLIGTDLRPTEGRSWRSDTLLLLAINWDTSEIGVLSFPRDLLVNIPTLGRTRINRADYQGEASKYPDGGFGLLRHTFQENFGIRLDHFVRLHRDGFVRVIDALGGVDVTVDCDLWEISPKTDNPEDGYNVLYIPAGDHTFDGVTALEFATFRYRTGDWDRSRRQQVVLLALRNQFASPETLTRLPDLWSALKDNFQTDLNLFDLLRYARLGISLDMNKVRANVIGRDETIGVVLESGAQVLIADGDKVYQAIENLFEARPIFEQAERPKGCPAAPDWAADYGTPTPTPAPE